jgi:ATP synthase subunit K
MMLRRFANWFVLRSQLSMITLGTLFGGSWLAMRGGDEQKKQGPPIKASSKDEEQFIQCVLSLVLESIVFIHKVIPVESGLVSSKAVCWSWPSHAYREFVKNVEEEEKKATKH